MTRTSVTVTSFAGASSAAGPRRSRVDLVCCTQGQRRRPPRGRAWCTYNAGQTVVQAASHLHRARVPRRLLLLPRRRRGRRRRAGRRPGRRRRLGLGHGGRRRPFERRRRRCGRRRRRARRLRVRRPRRRRLRRWSCRRVDAAGHDVVLERGRRVCGGEPRLHFRRRAVHRGGGRRRQQVIVVVGEVHGHGTVFVRVGGLEVALWPFCVLGAVEGLRRGAADARGPRGEAGGRRRRRRGRRRRAAAVDEALLQHLDVVYGLLQRAAQALAGRSVVAPHQKVGARRLGAGGPVHRHGSRRRVAVRDEAGHLAVVLEAREKVVVVGVQRDGRRGVEDAEVDEREAMLDLELAGELGAGDDAALGRGQEQKVIE
mmetsp:Transcript_5340/g.18925  ORF Transcript_5340/g.18925 Transcript_5340/m.18925 type:complete len:371 (-) Transcript_5340:1989-3101(-)